MNIVQQKDTTFTKIFVGGLPYHTTDKTLREFFQQFGEIEEAVVITDRQTGKSRGYGFVTMSDRKSTEQACLEPNPIIDGRKANVNLAYLGAKPRIPAAELLGLPFGLKTSALTLPGYMTGQIPIAAASYPHQYIYPYIGLSAHAPVTIPTSLVTTGPYIDYTTGAGLQPTAAYTTIQVPTGAPGSPAGYDMTAVNAFTQNGAYMPHGAFCPTTVSFAALPHQGAIGHYASHFQPAQIQ